MWTELSDTAILNKLGTRLKASRISRGFKQQELAAESGVGVSTIAKIESGQSVSLSLLISVMRTLGLLENLDLLVPEQKPSPMELLKMQGKQVKRVRTKKEEVRSTVASWPDTAKDCGVRPEHIEAISKTLLLYI